MELAEFYHLSEGTSKSCRLLRKFVQILIDTFKSHRTEFHFSQKMQKRNRNQPFCNGKFPTLPVWMLQENLHHRQQQQKTQVSHQREHSENRWWSANLLLQENYHHYRVQVTRSVSARKSVQSSAQEVTGDPWGCRTQAPHQYHKQWVTEAEMI